MTEIARKRQPRGVPVGGQFAEGSHEEAATPLSTTAIGFQTEQHERINQTDRKDRARVAHEELAAAVAALDKDENWLRALDQASKFRGYSFSNQMLIAIQCPNATRVSSAKRWKEIGRSPATGTKGITILAPMFRKEEEDGEEKRTLIGFTPVTVFDVSQTTGEPLEETWRELSEEPPVGYMDDLRTAIESHGFSVSYEDMSGQSGRGYTDFRSKRVVIDSSVSPGTQATTLAHELGHIACGHGDHVDDYHTGHGGKRNLMEVEADSFSYVLSRVNGMRESQRASSEYIAGWQKGEDHLSKTADKVTKAVKEIVGDGSGWRNAN